jgi:hypothetical protein
MSETPDIDPPDVGIGEAVAIGAAAAAAVACISCGTAIVGRFCAGCGQLNDDMRRSSFVLFKDFLKDTFAFDGRMWRTLGLLAAAPGTVPSNYSHGRRSRYTPPVRLLLVVSFLFFLALGLTHTLIVAVEVRARTPEETAAAKAAMEEGLKAAGPEMRAEVDAAAGDGAIVIGGEVLDCELQATTRYFVRPRDLVVDNALWTRCRDSILSGIRSEMGQNADKDHVAKEETERALSLVERTIAGITRAIEDPEAFNASLNNWLPRVMFVMAPVLALILTLFLRGRDALVFDHLVFSLYAHATAFAIIGLAIVAVQFSVPYVFTFASITLGLYFFVALKRGYKRGWIKTLWTSIGAGLLYLIALSSVVIGLLSRQMLAS